MMTKSIVPILLIFIGSLQGWGQSKDQADMKRYTKVPTGYLMVLRQGDNLFQELEKFAQAEKIPSANFSGMGFVNITFGFFNFETKQYESKDFKDVELASMQGTIAHKKDQISIHAHGVAGDKSFQTYGGHILGATVGTGSLEILVTVHDKAFEREKDEALGADVLNIMKYRERGNKRTTSFSESDL